MSRIVAYARTAAHAIPHHSLPSPWSKRPPHVPPVSLGYAIAIRLSSYLQTHDSIGFWLRYGARLLN
eukprot:1475784-Pleurochrysis_carterae.AAC.1